MIGGWRDAAKGMHEREKEREIERLLRMAIGFVCLFVSHDHHHHCGVRSWCKRFHFVGVVL